jgi:hypothetical protein
MKRTAAISLSSDTKRSRVNDLLPVMATHIYNYMINDPLVDWFKSQHVSDTHTKSNGFTDFLMERGREFEKKLVEYIHQHKIVVHKVSDTFSYEGCKQTKMLMQKGVPLLHSAPVFSAKNQTGGIIDLLVRSDHLHILLSESPLSDAESVIQSPGLNNKPYHYVVVDIKFSTLPLRADGRHLLNSDSYPAYKSQIWIYTQAVGEIQRYTSRYGYVLGRRWKYTKQNITQTSMNCLDKLGVIDYHGIDKHYIDETSNAVQWVRDVKAHGSEWSVSPPSRPELYPNMCVDSGSWNSEKQKLADKLGEITSVWYCGLKHRKNALEKGVKTWKNKKCTSNILGMSGSTASTVDKILDINRQNKEHVRPKVITTNLLDWRKGVQEVFVDFETISDIFSEFDNLPIQESMDIIFMIGVGWEEEGDWKYQSFTCANSSRAEEYRIMNEFNSLMKSMEFPKMWCWHAEPAFWNRSENRQFERLKEDECKHNISDNWNIHAWADMAKLFRDEPIVLKDCFKFGLKEVAGALRRHKLISAKMDSECSSGMTAMINAWKCYSTCTDSTVSPIMKDITVYNEWDCKVLWEILGYLRKNH